MPFFLQKCAWIDFSRIFAQEKALNGLNHFIFELLLFLFSSFALDVATAVFLELVAFSRGDIPRPFFSAVFSSFQVLFDRSWRP